MISKFDDITLSQRIGSASIGALLTSFLITPFNVVKVREQAEIQFHDPRPVCFPL